MTRTAPQPTYMLKATCSVVAAAIVLVVLVSCSSNDQAALNPVATEQPHLESTARRQMTRPPRTGHEAVSPPTTGEQRVAPPGMSVVNDEATAFTVADGYIVDGDWVTPFDTDFPAVSNLDPDLLAAVQRAWSDAAIEGIEMVITSGWRSEQYQGGLLDEAIVTYGSVDEARKWVNTPEESTHVTGDALDIGATDAAYWLSRHGYRYGLCQTYANEIWHYELATEPGGACPQPITDASSAASEM